MSAAPRPHFPEAYRTRRADADGAGAGRALANRVAAIAGGPLPAPVAEAARRAVLDCVGAALAGVRGGGLPAALAEALGVPVDAPPVGQGEDAHSEAETVARSVTEKVARDETATVARGEGAAAGQGAGGGPARSGATVLGRPVRLPAPQAALLNGAAAHSVELDDGHREGAIHPGAVVIPAALALGEVLQAPGSLLLRAVAAGYEAAGRIAAALNPDHFLRGFHTTGCVGPFGAAAAAAVLLRLEPEAVLGALGTAGLMGGGLLEVIHDGQELKGLHAGRAAQAGVLAALLARGGLRGPKTGLEGPKGFAHAFGEAVAWDRIRRGRPDGDWEILHTYVKPYPTCRHVHAPIDLALRLRGRHGFEGAAIAAVEVSTYSVAISETGAIFEPDAPGAARFSLPYAVACALVRGRVTLDDILAAGRDDGDVREIARRVRVVVDPARDRDYPGKRGASLLVRLRDGTSLLAEADLALGEPEAPLAWEALVKKFRGCAAELPRDRQDAFLAAVARLADDGAPGEAGAEPAVSDLLRPLRAPFRRGAASPEGDWRT